MSIFFYLGIIGNAIQFLQISTKLREPRKGMFMAEAMDEGEASKIKRKTARPFSSHQNSGRLKMRLKSEPMKSYVKELCIIWWSVSISKVEFKATAKHMLEVSKKLQDKEFFSCLIEITKTKNAVANDVVSHNRCCANARFRICPPQEKDDSISHTLSEGEVVSFGQTQLKDPD